MDSTISNLERLKILSESVFPLAMIANIDKYNVKYNVSTGECNGVGLFKNEEIAVQHAVLGKHTVMDIHYHDELEIIILYEGDLSIEYDNYSTVLEIGVPVTIPRGIKHFVKSIDGCNVIGITIPASSGYPSSINEEIKQIIQ